MATRMKNKAENLAQNRDNRPRACARYIRISPYKVRAVLDLIRGKDVNEALAILETTAKSSSEVVTKVLKSAIANAEHNRDMARINLYIAEIYADGGPILKRVMPRAKGRAYRINKRTSHITVILDEKKEDR